VHPWNCFFLWYINSIFYSTVKTPNIEDYSAREKLILQALFNFVLGSDMVRKEITAFTRSSHSETQGGLYKTWIQYCRFQKQILWKFAKSISLIYYYRLVSLYTVWGRKYVEMTFKWQWTQNCPSTFLIYTAFLPKWHHMEDSEIDYSLLFTGNLPQKKQSNAQNRNDNTIYPSGCTVRGLFCKRTESDTKTPL